jgi:biopolymer transport protein ExbD
VAEVETKQREAKGGTGLRRPKRRTGVRQDMTPMVDIAFLLLIFFMVTTVFRTPQAMEVNLPPDQAIEVPESNVMSVFIDRNSLLSYRMGTGPLVPIQRKELRRHFQDQVKLNPDLIILVKVDRKAKYEDMVNMMDELEFANMERFSLVELTPQEAEELMGAQ